MANYGIVSGIDLARRIKHERIICGRDEGEAVWENFFGWHIDLRLGREVYITSKKHPQFLEEGQYVTIRPGEFALLTCEETINMPDDLMGFISMKMQYKKLGLINISGFHVDPCHQGNLIFSTYNAGPNDIVLQKGSKVFMIFFCSLTSKMELIDCPEFPEGELAKINAGIQYTLNRHNPENKLQGISLDMVTSIKGTSVSLANSNARIEKLESNIKIYGSIAVAIIVGLFILLIGG